MDGVLKQNTNVQIKNVLLMLKKHFLVDLEVLKKMVVLKYKKEKKNERNWEKLLWTLFWSWL